MRQVYVTAKEPLNRPLPKTEFFRIKSRVYIDPSGANGNKVR